MHQRKKSTTYQSHQYFLFYEHIYVSASQHIKVKLDLKTVNVRTANKKKQL